MVAAAPALARPVVVVCAPVPPPAPPPSTAAQSDSRSNPSAATSRPSRHSAASAGRNGGEAAGHASQVEVPGASDAVHWGAWALLNQQAGRPALT